MGGERGGDATKVPDQVRLHMHLNTRPPGSLDELFLKQTSLLRIGMGFSSI